MKFKFTLGRRRILPLEMKRTCVDSYYRLGFLTAATGKIEDLAEKGYFADALGNALYLMSLVGGLKDDLDEAGLEDALFLVSELEEMLLDLRDALLEEDFEKVRDIAEEIYSKRDEIMDLLDEVCI